MRGQLTRDERKAIALVYGIVSYGLLAMLVVPIVVAVVCVSCSRTDARASALLAASKENKQ